jgi:paraquat-inducible protein B
MIEELGLRAQLRLQSVLTSQMSIQLDYHPETAFQYHGNGKLPEIPTIPMTFEMISEQLQDLPLEQIINDLTSALSSLNAIVSSPDVMNAITSMSKTMKTVDELARNMNDKLQPLADNANRTLGSVDQLAQNVNRNVQPLTENTISTLHDAQKALAEIEVLLNEDSIQIYNLNMALEEIVSAARSIRNFAETIERQPETLLKGRNPGE